MPTPVRATANRPMPQVPMFGQPVGRRMSAISGTPLPFHNVVKANRRGNGELKVFAAIKDGTTLDRPLRVAVVGGGPSGACAAESLAKGGVETYLIERKMDNCKVGSPQRDGGGSWLFCLLGIAQC